jgi:hypothetical protein
LQSSAHLAAAAAATLTQPEATVGQVGALVVVPTKQEELALSDRVLLVADQRTQILLG